MSELPTTGEDVYVTVGTALPRSDRAIVKGTAIKQHEILPSTFVLKHSKVLRLGEYGTMFSNPREALMTGESGPYGPGFDEQYGEVWAYSRSDLPV